MREIVPVFGRSILFAHSRRSLHGHPQPVAAPGDRPRRSLAAYFYTNGGSDDDGAPRTTAFVRPAQLGRWGKLVVNANYVSPMLVDGLRLAVRGGGVFGGATTGMGATGDGSNVNGDSRPFRRIRPQT